MSTPAALLDHVPATWRPSVVTGSDAVSDPPCVGRADLYFAEQPADIERAKALCAPCALQAACLQGALARGEAAGVWGGQLVVNGAVVARKRPRGRPRKNPAPPR